TALVPVRPRELRALSRRKRLHGRVERNHGGRQSEEAEHGLHASLLGLSPAAATWRYAEMCSRVFPGSGTTRMYGFGASQSPKISRASSSETEPAMITSSPCFQFTGVETRCFAVSWSESITRST